MVSFLCGACQTTLKKNQVNRHCESACPSAWVFTCVDCGKDFQGFEFDTHISCVTEADKYHGKFVSLTQAPKKPSAEENGAKKKNWPGFKSFVSSQLRKAGPKGVSVRKLHSAMQLSYSGPLTPPEAEELLNIRLKHRKYTLHEREDGIYAVYYKFSK